MSVYDNVDWACFQVGRHIIDDGYRTRMFSYSHRSKAAARREAKAYDETLKVLQAEARTRWKAQAETRTVRGSVGSGVRGITFSISKKQDGGYTLNLLAQPKWQSGDKTRCFSVSTLGLKEAWRQAVEHFAQSRGLDVKPYLARMPEKKQVSAWLKGYNQRNGTRYRIRAQWFADTAATEAAGGRGLY